MDGTTGDSTECALDVLGGACRRAGPCRPVIQPRGNWCPRNSSGRATAKVRLQLAGPFRPVIQPWGDWYPANSSRRATFEVRLRSPNRRAEPESSPIVGYQPQGDWMRRSSRSGRLVAQTKWHVANSEVAY
jgi:hypothetical protein